MAGRAVPVKDMIGYTRAGVNPHLRPKAAAKPARPTGRRRLPKRSQSGAIDTLPSHLYNPGTSSRPPAYSGAEYVGLVVPPDGFTYG